MLSSVALAACGFHGQFRGALQSEPHMKVKTTLPKYTDTTIELTEEQVAAFPGPNTRPFNERDWEPSLDAFGRPADMMLTPEQLAAFGEPAVRQLSYPSFEETEAELRDLSAQLGAALQANAEARNKLFLEDIELRSALGTLASELDEITANKKLAKKLKLKPKPAKKRATSTAVSSSSGDGAKSNNAAIAGVGLVAALGAAYIAYGGNADLANLASTLGSSAQ